MNLKTKFLVKALVGAVIGMLISAVLCSFGDNINGLLSERFAIFFQFLGSGLFGALANGGSIVYEFESWGILKSTLTHYLTTMGGFVLASTLLKWFSRETILIAVGFMTIAYVIIWIVQYFRGKREIERINRDLELMKHTGKEGERQ